MINIKAKLLLLSTITLITSCEWDDYHEYSNKTTNNIITFNEIAPNKEDKIYDHSIETNIVQKLIDNNPEYADILKSSPFYTKPPANNEVEISEPPKGYDTMTDDSFENSSASTPATPSF